MDTQVIGRAFGKGLWTVKCAGCGRIFEAKRRDAKACSATCRKRISRAVDQQQKALEELLMMAARIDGICKAWPQSQAVLDQVQLLAASARASAAIIKPPWRPMSLPQEPPAPAPQQQPKQAHR